MISVVVPTYNERDNLSQLFERLVSVFAGTDEDYEIVVVDDSSPDGTADMARRLGSDLGINIRVIVRESNPDLSRSVVRGIREAHGEVVVVMDADLQHPPEHVPELAGLVTDAIPIAVATRYSHGGRIVNWSPPRRLVSYGALLLAKILVPPARGVSDPISGFFAVDKRAIDPDTLSPYGYKILLECLSKIDPPDTAELGFVFASRERGESSLDLEQFYRFFVHAILTGLRYRFLGLID